MCVKVALLWKARLPSLASFAKIPSTLPLEPLNGWGQAESFAADLSTPTTATEGPFPGLCSLLSSLPRAELTGTCFSTSATAGWSVQHRLPGHPSKQGLWEQWHASSHCQPTSTSPSSEPCQGKVPTRSSIGHLNKSQHNWQMAQEWLVSSSMQRRKKPALSLHPGKHSNFLSWPSCHFKVISNFYAPEGEGEPNSRTIWSLLKTQNTLLMAQM